MPSPTTLVIAKTWDGALLSEQERASVTITQNETSWSITIDAPLATDPPPTSPPGSTSRLWEFQVVELMLLGDNDQYLELEFGPYGHYLVLELSGRRNCVRQGHAMCFEATRGRGRWCGKAQIPTAWIPPGCSRVNAYAIRGQGEARRYMAHSPTGGDVPDFHNLNAFVPLS